MKQQKTPKTNLRRGLTRRLLSYVRPYKGYVFGAFLFSLLFVGFTLIGPVLYGFAIDSMIGAGQVDFERVYYAVGGFAVCVLLAALSQKLLNNCVNSLCYRLVRDLRRCAFDKITDVRIRYIDSHAQGDTMARVVNDVDIISDGLLQGVAQLFTGVLTIIGTLVLMLTINWIIALIVFFITPLSLFVSRFIATRTYSMFVATSRIRGEQTAFVEEMVDNLKVVQAFNREDDNQKKFDAINEELTKTSLKSIFYSSLTNPCTRFVNSIVYAAVALSGALTLIYPGILPIAFTAGRLTTLLSYSNQYTKPFNEISGVVTELQNAVACAARIYELIDEPAQQPDASDAEILENARGDVSFEDVNFSYVPEKPLIRNLNISAASGQRVAIVGPTVQRYASFFAPPIRHGAAGYMADERHRARQYSFGRARRD